MFRSYPFRFPANAAAAGARLDPVGLPGARRQRPAPHLPGLRAHRRRRVARLQALLAAAPLSEAGAARRFFLELAR